MTNCQTKAGGKVSNRAANAEGITLDFDIQWQGSGTGPGGEGKDQCGPGLLVIGNRVNPVRHQDQGMNEEHCDDGNVGGDDEGPQLSDGGKTARSGGLDHQGKDTVRGEFQDHFDQAADDSLQSGNALGKDVGFLSLVVTQPEVGNPDHQGEDYHGDGAG